MNTRSRPTPIECRHYDALVGSRIMAVDWSSLDGEAVPVLLLDAACRSGGRACVYVLADPEGNGPGFLDHDLNQGGES